MSEEILIEEEATAEETVPVIEPEIAPQEKSEKPGIREMVKKPTFWAVLVMAAVVIAIVIGSLGLVLAMLLGRDKETPEDTTQTETTQASTEATLPPPEANPIGMSDFYTNEAGYLTCLATPSVLGIDVSFWQKEIDWQQVKDAGVEFVMIRAAWRGSEKGVLAEDDYAQANYQGASAAGIKVGAYIFSQAITPEEAVEEAEYLLSIVQDWNIEMPLVFDWEFIDEESRTADMDPRTLTDCAKAFCETVETAGYRPMIYFNTRQSLEMLYLRELTAYPFWLAQYDTVLIYPYKIDMWQYTETGSVPGIVGNVDINLYFPYDE